MPHGLLVLVILLSGDLLSRPPSRLCRQRSPTIRQGLTPVCSAHFRIGLSTAFSVNIQQLANLALRIVYMTSSSLASEFFSSSVPLLEEIPALIQDGTCDNVPPPGQRIL